MEQDNPDSAVKATQGGDVAGGQPRTWWWAEASIWTERMVSALGNGVKGGKPNAFFEKQGLFTFYAALEQLRHPR
jgi:hypothetical protein